MTGWSFAMAVASSSKGVASFISCGQSVLHRQKAAPEFPAASMLGRACCPWPPVILPVLQHLALLVPQSSFCLLSCSGKVGLSQRMTMKSGKLSRMQEQSGHASFFQGIGALECAGDMSLFGKLRDVSGRGGDNAWQPRLGDPALSDVSRTFGF